jgi:hypothetical protein
MMDRPEPIARLKSETEGHDFGIDDKMDCSDGPNASKLENRAWILSIVSCGVMNNRIYWNVSLLASVQVRVVNLGSRGREKGGQLRARQISVPQIISLFMYDP